MDYFFNALIGAATATISVKPIEGLTGVWYYKADELLFSGMIMNERQISGGSLYVSNSGVVCSSVLSGVSYANVYSGGIVTATITYGGSLYVRSGGVVKDTSLQGGTLQVTDGGTASSTTVLNFGTLCMEGTGNPHAIDTVVSSAGGLSVSGGNLENTLVHPYASAEIRGGTHTNFIVNNARQLSVSGGEINTFSISGGINYIRGNAKINELTISGGSTYIHGSCSITNVTINSPIYAYLSGGTTTSLFIGQGTVSGTPSCIMSEVVVSSGGNLRFYGNQLSSVVVSSAAVLHVISNTARVYSLTVCAGGTLTVSTGAIASSADISGYAVAAYAGVIRDADIVGAGSMSVSSGGGLLLAHIYKGGRCVVWPGGYISSTWISSGGSVRLHSNAYIGEGGLVVYPHGSLYVSSGVQHLGHYIDEQGGSVYVPLDVTRPIFIHSFSNLALSSGAATVHTGTTAVSTTLLNGGSLQVYLNGSADNTFVSSGGSLIVSSGGTATNTTVYTGGSMVVTSGAALNIKETGGYVKFFGTVNATFTSWTFAENIASGISTTVHSGTTAALLNVEPGGVLFVESGGSIKSVTISSGGSLSINSNGRLTNITGRSGAVINFTGAPSDPINFTIINGPNTNISEGTLHYTNSAFTGYATNGNFYNLSGRYRIGVGSGISVHSPRVGSPGAQARIYAISGAVISGASIGISGDINLYPGASALDTILGGYTANVRTECELTVWGGSASNVTVSSNAYLNIISGGGCQGDIHVVSGGSVRLYNNASAEKIDMTGRNTFLYASGGALIGFLNYTGGTAWIAGSTTVISSAIVRPYGSSGGSLLMASRAAVKELVMSGGTARVSSGAIISSALLSGLTVSGRPTLHLLSSASIVSLTLTSRAGITLSRGADANNITQNGGFVIARAATISSARIFGSDFHVSGGTVVNQAVAVVGRDVNIKKSIVVSSGGSIINLSTDDISDENQDWVYNVESNYGVLKVLSGGRVSWTDFTNIEVSGGAIIFEIRPKAVRSGIGPDDIGYVGSLFVASGGTVWLASSAGYIVSSAVGAEIHYLST